MKKRILIILAAAVPAAGLIIMQMSLLGRLKSQNESLKQFINQTRDDLGYINESQELMKQNTQQVRQYLSLPALEFPQRERENQDEGEQPEIASFELAAYDAAAYLNNYNIAFRQISLFNEFLDAEDFSLFLKENGLSLKKLGDFDRNLIGRGGSRFFSLHYDKEKDLVEITPDLGGKKRVFSRTDEESLAFLADEWKRQSQAYGIIDSFNKQLRTLSYNSTFKNLLRDKDITLGALSYKGENLYLPLIRKDKSVLTALTTDTEKQSFRLQDQDFFSLEELIAGVKQFLEESDLRTDAEILDDLVLQELGLLIKDEAFSAHLAKMGLTVRMEPREDNDYIYYDMINKKGERAGAYALQKEFGELYLMDKEDIPVRSLKAFAPGHDLTFSFQISQESGSEISSFIPARGSKNFLLIGSHEHNADTMIIVQCDSVSGEIKMLGIPRDLYYKGLKINSIYRNYGPARLASELSSITGLNITNYIAIDMYAFIDVVNLLGGVDVTLDEPLIDPTYKVRENGKWSTLYYPAGMHHLDGIAALRITRSRHTSSDFERSVRQQEVIAALRDSLGGLGLTDITKIYDFMQIAEKYLNTNMSTSEMVRYFMTYKDFKINGQNVLNTDNVLYATWTNLYRLSEEEQEKALEDPEFYRGGWIVLPKNNDWSQIKLFIQSIMTSS